MVEKIRNNTELLTNRGIVADTKDVYMFNQAATASNADQHVYTQTGIIVVDMQFKRGFDLKLGKEAFVLAEIDDDPSFGWTTAT